MSNPADFRPGAVLRLPRLGPIVPEEGHDIVAVFLGACLLEEEPDASAALRRMGWQRSFVFEARLTWADECEACGTFTANSPEEATRALVRWATYEEGRACLSADSAQLLAINVGPIGASGAPQTRRGRVFLSWNASTGESLASFVDRYLAPNAASSPTPHSDAPAAGETAAPSATPATIDEPA